MSSGSRLSDAYNSSPAVESPIKMDIASMDTNGQGGQQPKQQQQQQPPPSDTVKRADSEKRQRPERQLYRPPASRLSRTSTKQVSVATTTTTSTSSKSTASTKEEQTKSNGQEYKSNQDKPTKKVTATNNESSSQPPSKAVVSGTERQQQQQQPVQASSTQSVSNSNKMNRPSTNTTRGGRGRRPTAGGGGGGGRADPAPRTHASTYNYEYDYDDYYQASSYYASPNANSYARRGNSNSKPASSSSNYNRNSYSNNSNYYQMYDEYEYDYGPPHSNNAQPYNNTTTGTTTTNGGREYRSQRTAANSEAQSHHYQSGASSAPSAPSQSVKPPGQGVRGQQPFPKQSNLNESNSSTVSSANPPNSNQNQQSNRNGTQMESQHSTGQKSAPPSNQSDSQQDDQAVRGGKKGGLIVLNRSATKAELESSSSSPASRAGPPSSTGSSGRPSSKPIQLGNSANKPGIVSNRPKAQSFSVVQPNSSNISPSSHHHQRVSSSGQAVASTGGTNNSSTPPKGGILRLNHESMKLLNQTLKNDSDMRQLSLEENTVDTVSDVRCVSSANLNMDYARSLADKLDYIVHTSKHGLDHSDLLIEPLRHKLNKFYEQILLYDLNLSRTHNALPMIWQNCFYQFIDYYRMEYKRFPVNVSNTTKQSPSELPPLSKPQLEQQQARRNLSLLSGIIAEGTKFFETLIHKLKSTYNFSYKSLLERRKHYDLNRSLFSVLQEITYNVKIIFIYLGDLSRYHQSVQNRPNFEQAKGFYLKAHMLVPKNSHACSQIAMICYYQKNHFDAIYYFIRSFETESSAAENSNTVDSYSPTPSGTLPGSSRHQHKQMLTVIFDDIRHCYDDNLKKLKAEHAVQMEQAKLKKVKAMASHSRINKYYRIEYWVRPSGSVSKCDMYNFYDLAAIASNEEDPDLLHFYKEHILPNFTCRDLKKRFIFSFLMVHGMLNCRSGLDRFFDVANQMLLEFDSLLNHRYSTETNNNTSASSSTNHESHSLSSIRLIQLVVINMYTISNTLTEDDRVSTSAQYSFTHMNAYFIMSTMMIMILRRLIELFDVFHRKHVQFMDEFVAMNGGVGGGNGNGKQHQHNNHREDHHREVFEEEANIEDLFECPKRSRKESNNNNNSNAKERHSSVSESDAEVQAWKDFYLLLPCVKIWADWVISTRPRFPPQEMNDLKTKLDENIWHVFSKFLSLFDQIKKYPVNFYTEEKNQLPLSLSPPKKTDSNSNVKYEYELVQLPEDRCLEGFKLIMNAPESSKYIKLPFIPDIAYTYMRIASIQLFGDYLCGLKNPYLRYNTKKAYFESQIGLDDIEGDPGLKLKTIQEEAFHEALQKFIKLQQELGISSDELIKEEKGVPTEEEDEDYEDEQEAIEEMNKLDISSVERRKLLQYRMLSKLNQKHGRYFRMIENMTEPKRRFVIQPRYVVFDTNCFINDLEAIKHFVKTVPFLVTVPLIVVHELEFILSRGTRIEAELAVDPKAHAHSDPDKIERFISISKKAKDILDFLQDAFANRRAGVKAITSKGSILDTIDFKEEFDNPDAFNNDDLVLYSCTNLIKEEGAQTSQTMKKMLEGAGEKVTDRDEYIYRDVILITDDLNLRLKSLCFEVPVKKLRQFLKWTRALYREQNAATASSTPQPTSTPSPVMMMITAPNTPTPAPDTAPDSSASPTPNP